jgi:hypothetical protein
MEMLGHDDVADNFKFVFAADLLEDIDKNIARVPAGQQRSP